jgi:hypothetical protein
MPSYNFSPIGSALTTQAVAASATKISTSNTIPGGARYAEGFVRTASIVETRDGTTPTATLGTEWDAGDIILLRSRREITNFQAIEKTSGSSETIDWTFYNRAPN